MHIQSTAKKIKHSVIKHGKKESKTMKNNETSNRHDEIDTLHFDLSVLDELLYMDFAEVDQALNIQAEQAG